jgi:hypothetical protein
MRYRIVRELLGETEHMMSQDFEDRAQFRLIAKEPIYKIFCDGRDVTHKYRDRPPGEKGSVLE